MAIKMSKRTRLIIVILIVTIVVVVGVVLSRSSCSRSTLLANQAPDFTLPTMTGANVTLSELAKAPVALVFWTTSCSYCNIELHLLEDVAQQSEGDIKVIAINVGQSLSTIQNFFGDYEPTMIIALDENGEVFVNYSQEDNPRGYIPITFFLDSEGIVKHVKVGAFTNEEQLQEALGRIL